MDQLQKQFKQYLEKEEKENAVRFAQRVVRDQVSIQRFYEEILTPAMNTIECHNEEEDLCIFREHIRSGILRSVIESLYPVILEQRSHATGKKAVVLCPDGEFHEMGARVVADYFTLLGYDSIFIGNSTPKESVVDAINYFSPDILAFSVTNYYNLHALQKTVEWIKNRYETPPLLLAGGNAVYRNRTFVEDLEVTVIQQFKDLEQALKGGESNETGI
ncbi:MAG TPA: hypothetical protein DHN33_02595 [Eubacteriaceae bacterium]|nr:hypothetical protein [Eubacteriaceae bacterium]